MAGKKSESFLILLKGSHGAATEHIIKQVISDPDVFVYGEFLNHSAVKELPDTSEGKKLLDLFVFGSFEDYSKDIPLTPSELKKLSLVRIASQRKVISYAEIQKRLEITETDLEPLLLECMWKGLIRGKLDQVERTLTVDSTMGQDVAPGDLSSMKDRITNWMAHLAHLGSFLDEQIGIAENETKSRSQTRIQLEQEIRMKEIQLANDRKKKDESNGRKGGRGH